MTSVQGMTEGGLPPCAVAMPTRSTRLARRGGRQRRASTAWWRGVPGLWDVVVTTDFPLVVVVVADDVVTFAVVLSDVARCERRER